MTSILFATGLIAGSVAGLLLVLASRARHRALAAAGVAATLGLLALTLRPWSSGGLEFALALLACCAGSVSLVVVPLALSRLRRLEDAAESALELREELREFRQEASSKVERRERRLRELTRIRRLGVFEADDSGGIRFANRQFLEHLGLRRRPRGVDEWIDRVHEEHAAEFHAAWTNAVRLGEACEHEFRRAPPDESTWLRWEAHPQPKEGTGAGGWLGTLVDVSERRQLEARVSRSEKLESLGTLTSGIAHDFNNLLVGILGTADLILDDETVPPDLREEVQHVHDAARQAADLVRHMLNHVGRDRTVLRILDIEPVVRELCGLMDSTRHDVQIARETTSCLVKADSVQIRQLLMNLITNAVEAEDAARVRVEVRLREEQLDAVRRREYDGLEQAPDGDYAVLSVRDRGPGIDPAHRDQVFEPFFTTKTSGRGLGMSVVRRVTHRHGGGVRITSASGQGCEVRIALPVDRAHLPTADPASAPMVPWRGTGRVLVVDDEAPVRSVARRMLERVGFDVIEAANGPEALRWIDEHGHELSVVLLDLFMPGMKGDAVLREIRRRLPDLPILLCSGNAQDFSESPDAEGIAGLLEKPYQLSALRLALREVFAADPIDPSHSSS